MPLVSWWGFDMPREIEQLTVEDYVRAFEAAFKHIREHHKGIVRSHYRAKNFTATAGELAYHMGYEGHEGINAQYGLFADGICGSLNVDPVMKLDVLVTTSRSDDGTVLLMMRPVVVDALRMLSPPWL